MNARGASSFVVALVLLVLPNVIPGSNRISSTAAAPPIPRITLALAPAITLPGVVDSNSPAIWDLL
jgi:hypothetical protein